MTPRCPTVSVIIPTHNRRDLICETIQSVLNQTFEDFEILVVDNGSTDDTQQIVCAMGDSRIRYIYQENTGGPAGPRNTGIRNAWGKYIAFLDSDDLWLPHKLALQVEVLDRDLDIGLVFARHQPFGDGMVEADPWPSSISEARPGKIFKSLFLSWNFIPCLTVVTRREVLERIGGFDEEPALKTIEDLDLWLRIAHTYNIQCIHEVVSKYRLHRSNLKDNLCNGGIEFLFFRNLNISAKFRRRGWVSYRLFTQRIIFLLLSTTRILIREGKYSIIRRVSQAAYHVYLTCEYIYPEKLIMDPEKWTSS